MTTPLSPVPHVPRRRIFTRARILVLLALGAVLVLCFAFSWMTRDAVVNLAFLRARRGAAHSPVDTRPWQTAQTLASLAVTAEEHEYAREAEHLADHEVDQAFAAALRAAELQSRHQSLTGQALVLSHRVAQLQQEVAQDQALVNRLKAKTATPAPAAKSAASAAAGTDALQVAQAQLGLDNDELTDAQRDLDRATGNASVNIQNELTAHEAAMRQYDQAQQQDDGQTAVVTLKHQATLVGRLESWFDQRSRYASLQQALAEAQSDATTLTAAHNALESQANAAIGSGAPATLSRIEDSATQRQILSIDDDRIQTDQQLATVYSRWSDQVLLQHRIVLHMLLQSLELILFIVLAMILGDALIRRLLTHPRLDRRQTRTLRTVLEVGVQVLGVILIVFVLFGPPHETATMIGLATAALAIALQDYILAFLGWFMLVGKNGIRVGDLVEIDGVCGEVIDVGLMTTTLLETTGLAENGEPTGRTVSFLNSFAIRGKCFNFSGEGQWLWDEITVTVPSTEDIYALAGSVENAAREETAESARLAELEWNRTAHSTSLTRLSATPIVIMRPSLPALDNTTSIDIRIRYVTRATGRLEVRDRLYRHVIQQLKGTAVPHTPALAGTAP